MSFRRIFFELEAFARNKKRFLPKGLLSRNDNMVYRTFTADKPGHSSKFHAFYHRCATVLTTFLKLTLYPIKRAIGYRHGKKH
jgi:hypothetical protein